MDDKFDREDLNEKLLSDFAFNNKEDTIKTDSNASDQSEKNLQKELFEDRAEERQEEDFQVDDGIPFYDENKTKMSPNLKVVFLVPLVIMIVGVAVSIAFFRDHFAVSDSESEIPLIKADIDPVKVKPKDPGGMEVPNMDKEVFDKIASTPIKQKELPKVERILPLPEEPVKQESIRKIVNVESQNDVNAGAKIDQKEVKNILSSMSKSLPTDLPDSKKQNAEKDNESPKKQELKTAIKPKAVKTAQTKVEKLSSEVSIPSEEPVKVVEPKAKEVKLKEITVSDLKAVPKLKKRPKLAAPKKTIAAKFKIQLGSFRSDEDVKSEWGRLKKKHKKILQSYNYYSQKADVGEKGVFYRLQVGPFENESDARQACQKLIEQKQGCFFVKSKKQ